MDNWRTRVPYKKLTSTRHSGSSPRKRLSLAFTDLNSAYRSPVHFLRQSLHNKRPPIKRTQRPSSVQSSFSRWSMDNSALNPDWAKSPLNKGERAPTQTSHNKSPVQKGLSSIEELKKELQIKNYPRVKPTVKEVNKAKQQLMDVRTMTVAILQSIKEREKVLKQLEENPGPEIYNKYLLVSSKVQSLISNWKDLNNPYTQFIYNSQDYALKIERETQELQARFRDL